MARLAFGRVRLCPRCSATQPCNGTPLTANDTLRDSTPHKLLLRTMPPCDQPFHERMFLTLMSSFFLPI